MQSDRQSLLLKCLVLILVAKLTTQAVRYYVQVDSVQKTLVAQLLVYHQRGANAYTEDVTRELERIGLKLPPGSLAVVEDRRQDELRVELTYAWPLEILWMSFERVNVATARSTILDG